MTKAIQIAKLALIIVATALLAVILYETITLSPKIRETVSNINDTSGTVKDYVQFQIEIVKSPAYQKNFEHASEVGDIGAKLLAQIARQVVPRFNRNLDELQTNQVELRRGLGNVADLTAHTDRSINGPNGLLPGITKLVDKLGVTTEEFNAALTKSADSLGITTAELSRRLADPRIDRLMDEALGIAQETHGTMTEVHGTAGEVHKAAQEAPEIAQSLAKIAKESSRFARITLIANILGTLGRAFLP